jgi:hypothetical protein
VYLHFLAMPLKRNLSIKLLKGGFRFGHRGYLTCKRDEMEPRKRLGTTVSETTYMELFRLADYHQLRLSQILDEATESGVIAKSAEALSEKTK